MKNLPDDELFNAVENRLRSYSELPHEDTWSEIAKAIPTSNVPHMIYWTNRLGAAVALALLFLLVLNNNAVYDKDQTIHNPVTANNFDEEHFKDERSPAKTRVSEIPSHPSIGIKNDFVAEGDSFKPATMQGHISATENVFDNSSSTDPVATGENENLFAESGDKIEVKQSKEIKDDSISSAKHVLPPKTKQKRTRISFYTVVSPSLSFQHITPDAQDDVVIEKFNSPGVISAQRFGFGVDAGLQGRISDRFQYIAGLSYYQQSQQLEYEEKTDGAVIESGDDLNFVVRPGTVQRSFDYCMRNLGLQAGVLYTLKQKGLMHKAGIVLQFQKGFLDSREGDIYTNSASSYVNYQLIYRVEYAIDRQWNIFLQPGYTHSIIVNESLDAPFTLKQGRASLGVGIVYSF